MKGGLGNMSFVVSYHGKFNLSQLHDEIEAAEIPALQPDGILSAYTLTGEFAIINKPWDFQQVTFFLPNQTTDIDSQILANQVTSIVEAHIPQDPPPDTSLNVFAIQASFTTNFNNGDAPGPNDIIFVAVPLGELGNSIPISIISGDQINQPISVDPNYLGKGIQVTLALDNGQNILSTAKDVADAVNASNSQWVTAITALPPTDPDPNGISIVGTLDDGELFGGQGTGIPIMVITPSSIDFQGRTLINTGSQNRS